MIRWLFILRYHICCPVHEVWLPSLISILWNIVILTGFEPHRFRSRCTINDVIIMHHQVSCVLYHNHCHHHCNGFLHYHLFYQSQPSHNPSLLSLYSSLRINSSCILIFFLHSVEHQYRSSSLSSLLQFCRLPNCVYFNWFVKHVRFSAT